MDPQTFLEQRATQLIAKINPQRVREIMNLTSYPFRLKRSPLQEQHFQHWFYENFSKVLVLINSNFAALKGAGFKDELLAIENAAHAIMSAHTALIRSNLAEV